MVAPISVTQAFLDGRQQRVLLGLVEAVDLVEEEDRPRAAGRVPVRGALEHRADLGAARLHRAQLLEDGLRAFGDHPRQRRLTRPRRAVEDHRVRLAALDRGAQTRCVAQQVRLPHEFLERARPQSRRQRPRVVLAVGARAGLAALLRAAAGGPAALVIAARAAAPALPRGGLAGRFGLEQGVHL